MGVALALSDGGTVTVKEAELARLMVDCGGSERVRSGVGVERFAPGVVETLIGVRVDGVADVVADPDEEVSEAPPVGSALAPLPGSLLEC